MTNPRLGSLILKVLAAVVAACLAGFAATFLVVRTGILDAQSSDELLLLAYCGVGLATFGGVLWAFARQRK
jgi:hypothetical protein